PFYYKLSPASVYAYFKEIGRNTPIDVTLYNIPMFASPIDVPTIQRLSEECERIVAIKDSSGEIPNMIRMIQAVKPNRPDFAFLTGWDAALMPMLLVGCDGGTNASSGVVPELTRRLYDLTTSYQIDAARAVQYDLVKLFDTMIYSAEFGRLSCCRWTPWIQDGPGTSAIVRPAEDRYRGAQSRAAVHAIQSRIHRSAGGRLSDWRREWDRCKPGRSFRDCSAGRRRTSPPRSDVNVVRSFNDRNPVCQSSHHSPSDECRLARK
ncbi:MAG TPA: dihydrodipicolinate synthase family protein, partial [Planctomycetaceae bacterium]|nr:dihydrodipicolinate synthase family protein [Planctomycetaceae bacterium]